MAEPGGGQRLEVRFSEGVWRQAIRGFSGRALEVASAARNRIERNGIELGRLRPCEAEGPDGTELAGCAKLYLPDRRSVSEQPFAFVLQLARTDEGLIFVFVAFGPRHPGAGVRSAYERAHRQLHGRFPA